MKRKLVLISMLVIIALLFTSIAVLAAAPSDKPTPNSHPGNSPDDRSGNKGEKQGKIQNFKGTVTGKEASGLEFSS